MILHPSARTLLLRSFASIAICITVATTTSAQHQPAGRHREPIIGRPCEGCEGVFEGLPTTLSSVTRIAPPGEPGTPMVVEGVVRDGRGAAVAGITV